MGAYYPDLVYEATLYFCCITRESIPLGQVLCVDLLTSDALRAIKTWDVS